MHGLTAAGGGVVVVGGGPGGLAAGYCLGRAGVRYQILERGDAVGQSWRSYYDSLRLNSPRSLSSLPGLALDRESGRWPLRHEMVTYLDRYVRVHRLAVRCGVEVSRIDRGDGGWSVTTSDGERRARAVIVATGVNARAVMPAWAGSDGFTGLLQHASEYRNATPYEGRDVLVVGPGSTGKDIALELIGGGAGRVRLSIRTPPLMFPPSVLGLPVDFMTQMVKHLPRFTDPVSDRVSLAISRWTTGDLSRYGIGRPPEGLMSAMRSRSHGATIERGFVAALRAGQISVVPAVERFDGADVVLARGERIQPDVVIAATGQQPDLEGLVGHLDVLDGDGYPKVHGASELPGLEGLHFLGYRLPPGQLPDMRIDGRRIARRLAAQRPAGRLMALTPAPNETATRS